MMYICRTKQKDKMYEDNDIYLQNKETWQLKQFVRNLEF